MAWAWKTLSGPLGAVLDGPMKLLENSLRGAEKYMPIAARVATTDATVTTLATLNVPVDTTLLVRGFVVARRTGGSGGSANDGAGYRVEFVGKNSAGTAALIGAGTVTVLGESQAGWDVTLSASGGGIRVRVTGAVNNNISWRWTGSSVAVKNED